MSCGLPSAAISTTQRGSAPGADSSGASLATDASADQIAQARPLDRVHYRVAVAEASGLGAGSVDLVPVAQAAHWFRLPAFHAEARWVLTPGGAVAAS